MVLSIKKLWPLESGCTANSKILSSIFLNRFIINLLISHMGIQCTRYITCVRSGAEMGIFGGAGTPPPSCPSSLQCAEWARIYLKYCLCSPKDGVALTLGLLSVISWGVAEVPQIITNYRHKSTEGLSIAFLMTWIVGYAPALSLFFGCVFFMKCLMFLGIMRLYFIALVVLPYLSHMRLVMPCLILCVIHLFFYYYAEICLTLSVASWNLLQ
jgi:uncharacterized protein with PQ loop repeat